MGTCWVAFQNIEQNFPQPMMIRVNGGRTKDIHDPRIIGKCLKVSRGFHFGLIIRHSHQLIQSVLKFHIRPPFQALVVFIVGSFKPISNMWGSISSMAVFSP
jgi:hypothetical protein